MLPSKARRWWNRRVPTWLWFVNFLALQWFTLRLARTKNVTSGRTVAWRLMVGVVPLTGWWSSYVWLGWRRDARDPGRLSPGLWLWRRGVDAS